PLITRVLSRRTRPLAGSAKSRPTWTNVVDCSAETAATAGACSAWAEVAARTAAVTIRASFFIGPSQNSRFHLTPFAAFAKAQVASLRPFVKQAVTVV